MNKRIAIIHPEGNILYNANLLGIVEILREKGYLVDIYCPKRNISQYVPYPTVRFIFYNKVELFFGKIEILKSVKGIVGIGRSIDRFVLCKSDISASLIIGVDREGIILGSKIAKTKKIPYGLISYEIFFNKETGEDFKKEEIKACQDIDFAVCQDPLRAEKLAEENMIPAQKIINIPVGGRFVEKGPKNFFLHDEFGISHDKHIVLYIGEGSDWTRMPDLVKYAQDWQEDWVLVIRLKYGINNYMKQIVEQYKNSKKVFFSLSRVNSCKELTPLIKSADMGVALYKATYANYWLGDNLKYLGLSSGKISAYLQHGLPVIVNDIGLWSDNIRTYKLGFVVDDKIILPSADELEQYKGRCYEFFEEKLDLNKTIAPLLDKIETILP